MSKEVIVSTAKLATQQADTGALLLGASLALTSMILLPALAMRLGLSSSLTGALRIALMKASHRATSQKAAETNKQLLLPQEVVKNN